MNDMKKMMRMVRDWYFTARAQSMEKMHSAKERRLRTEVCRDVQVREYRGNIYVAYKDVPMLRVDRLDVPSTAALEEMRATVMNYRSDEPSR